MDKLEGDGVRHGLLPELSSCTDLYSGPLAFSVRNGQFWSVLDWHNRSVKGDYDYDYK